MKLNVKQPGKSWGLKPITRFIQRCAKNLNHTCVTFFLMTWMKLWEPLMIIHWKVLGMKISSKLLCWE